MRWQNREAILYLSKETTKNTNKTTHNPRNAFVLKGNPSAAYTRIIYLKTTW